MMGRTHALTGVALGLLTVPALSSLGVHPGPATIPLLVACAAGGAMMPDFDHPSATIAYSLGPLTKALARGVSAAFGGHRNGTHSVLGTLVFTGVCFAAMSAGGLITGLWCGFLLAVGLAALHLRFSAGSMLLHTVASLVLGVALMALVRAYGVDGGTVVTATLGFAVGYVSHWLLADGLTKEGFVPAWPLSKRRVSFAQFTTGQFFETSVFAPLMCVAIAAETWWLFQGPPAPDVAALVRGLRALIPA